MPLSRREKEAVVDRVATRLKDVEAIIIADYRGLTVSQLGRLRGELRRHDSELHVIKNTLARRAFQRAGLEPPDDLLSGPTALLFFSDELAGPAKALLDFVKEANELLVIKGGLVSGRRTSEAGVKALAELPSREELRGLLLGALNAPPRQLVTVLSSPLRDLAGVIQARVDAGPKAA
jgi:large subunit ribosomal protein L10